MNCVCEQGDDFRIRLCAAHDSEFKIRHQGLDVREREARSARDKMFSENTDLRKKLQDLVEATGPVFEELLKANPYDRRDVRFPSKAETLLRKAVEACVGKPAPVQECAHDWASLLGSAKGFTKKCRLCDRLEV